MTCELVLRVSFQQTFLPILTPNRGSTFALFAAIWRWRLCLNQIGYFFFLAAVKRRKRTRHRLTIENQGLRGQTVSGHSVCAVLKSAH